MVSISSIGTNIAIEDHVPPIVSWSLVSVWNTENRAPPVWMMLSQQIEHCPMCPKENHIPFVDTMF